MYNKKSIELVYIRKYDSRFFKAVKYAKAWLEELDYPAIAVVRKRIDSNHEKKAVEKKKQRSRSGYDHLLSIMITIVLLAIHDWQVQVAVVMVGS